MAFYVCVNFFLVCTITFFLTQHHVFIYDSKLPTLCNSCQSGLGACLCADMCVWWVWCGMEVTSVRSNIQSSAVMWRALSRDNHQETQVQLPSVLFLLCGTHTNKHTLASCKLTHCGGKAPHGRIPRIAQSPRNICFCLLYQTGRMGALANYFN